MDRSPAAGRRWAAEAAGSEAEAEAVGPHPGLRRRRGSGRPHRRM